VKIPLTAIVLARDEVPNLRRTLPKLVERLTDVVVVDSYSSDGTPGLAEAMGARVLAHGYEYHAQQINWALRRLGEDAERWMLILNADELPDAHLLTSIEDALGTMPNDYHGYLLTFKVYFMGRWIKHGGYYPLRVLRLFRRGLARCEDRRMDEKILVDGPIGTLAGHVIDWNVKRLEYFVDKHNSYSTREAHDFLMRRSSAPADALAGALFGSGPERRRWMKRVYDRLPLRVRARMYYWYRLYARLGFLDGPEGRAFHFLQAYWYRYLVDLKIQEAQRQEGGRAPNDPGREG
jgi:glycosyltransferase involved in cell wall biosynthesis